MKQRVISGVVGVGVLIAVLLSDKIIVNIGMALVSFIALLEMYEAAGLERYLPLKLLGLAASFAFTFAYSWDNKLLMPVIYFYTLALFAMYMKKDSGLKLHDISKMFFLTIFICFFMVHIVFIRKLNDGEFLIWTLFIGAFLTDTFAYLTGRTLGRHKLCPRISPKKTVEGAIGGFVGSTAGMLLYGLIIERFFDLGVNYANMVFLGLACSAAAQFGDLAASAIKRQYNIKDYGNLMPGHGGVMDRFDSVIFTAPVVYLIASNIPLIFVR
ncbi:MAG: Phosphatidate cytidylyltransferase [Firmicutes bacterium ADurb.Bin193]|nr:MAG: Phosphatidate cytidylyltransferase [Firmicutes bacterium ADurb.Bin193]